MTQSAHHDVAVLGGGPAGAAAAIALRRAGFSVVMFDAAQNESVRVGETLQGDVVQPLSRLGVWQRFLSDGHEPAPTITLAWGAGRPRENSSISSPYGCGWHLDRRRFDAMLVEAAEAAGAVVHRCSRVEHCERDVSRRWQLFGRGTNRAVSSNWLVDATGRSGWLARRMGARRHVYDRLVAMVGFGRCVNSESSYTVIEACRDGWWYAAALPQGRSVTAFFTDSDLMPGFGTLAGFWQACLERTDVISQFADRVDSCKSLRIVTASTAVLDRAVGDGWLAVGDAARSGDPLSGQGVMTALKSGLRAAAVISAHRAGDLRASEGYSAEIHEQLRQFQRSQQMAYAQEDRWRESVFWGRRRRHSAETEDVVV